MAPVEMKQYLPIAMATEDGVGGVLAPGVRTRSPRRTASAWMTERPPSIMCWVPCIWERRETLLPASWHAILLVWRRQTVDKGGVFTVSMYSPLACLGGMIAQRWPEYCMEECRFMMRLWDLPWYGREELSSTVTLESCHGLSKSVMVVGAQTRSLLKHDEVS